MPSSRSASPSQRIRRCRGGARGQAAVMQSPGPLRPGAHPAEPYPYPLGRSGFRCGPDQGTAHHRGPRPRPSGRGHSRSAGRRRAADVAVAQRWHGARGGSPAPACSAPTSNRRAHGIRGGAAGLSPPGTTQVGVSAERAGTGCAAAHVGTGGGGFREGARARAAAAVRLRAGDGHRAAGHCPDCRTSRSALGTSPTRPHTRSPLPRPGRFGSGDLRTRRPPLWKGTQ